VKHTTLSAAPIARNATTDETRLSEVSSVAQPLREVIAGVVGSASRT
jgi:hypothetical protein